MARKTKSYLHARHELMQREEKWVADPVKRAWLPSTVRRRLLRVRRFQFLQARSHHLMKEVEADFNRILGKPFEGKYIFLPDRHSGIFWSRPMSIAQIIANQVQKVKEGKEPSVQEPIHIFKYPRSSVYGDYDDPVGYAKIRLKGDGKKESISFSMELHFEDPRSLVQVFPKKEGKRNPPVEIRTINREKEYVVTTSGEIPLFLVQKNERARKRLISADEKGSKYAQKYWNGKKFKL